MSIPIRFKIYDFDGILIAERTILTVSYTDNPGDLNKLQNRLLDISPDEHRKYLGETAKYLVPHSASDYMFDIDDIKAIIPNRFKER